MTRAVVPLIGSSFTLHPVYTLIAQLVRRALYFLLERRHGWWRRTDDLLDNCVVVHHARSNGKLIRRPIIFLVIRLRYFPTRRSRCNLSSDDR